MPENSQPDTQVYVVVRRGNRDIEDCEWFEITDEDKDNLMEQIYDQRTLK